MGQDAQSLLTRHLPIFLDHFSVFLCLLPPSNIFFSLHRSRPSLFQLVSLTLHHCCSRHSNSTFHFYLPSSPSCVFSVYSLSSLLVCTLIMSYPSRTLTFKAWPIESQPQSQVLQLANVHHSIPNLNPITIALTGTFHQPIP